VVADALSRIPSVVVLLLTISVVQIDVLDLIKVSYALGLALQNVLQNPQGVGKKKPGHT